MEQVVKKRASKKSAENTTIENTTIENTNVEKVPVKRVSKKSVDKTNDKSVDKTNDKVPIKRTAKQITILESVKIKSMWVGSHVMQTTDFYVYENDMFVNKQISYPPSLYKIIDEIVVNAIDHHIHYPKLVTEIRISVTDSGLITVYNNGPGMPVEKVLNKDGVEMYSPELNSCEFLAGDNLDKDDNIKGGTNGIGLKAANALSDLFILETVDMNNLILYTQTIKNGLTIREPPVLNKVTKTQKPYTKISFLPSYATQYKINIIEYIDTLKSIIHTRTIFAAAYTNASVYFNDVKIDNNFSSFCSLFTTYDEIYCCPMIKRNKTAEEKEKYGDKLDWSVGFSLTDGKSNNITMVNGIHITNGGTHVKYIQNLLVQNIKPFIESDKDFKASKAEFNKNLITNNVFIFMKGTIPNPQFSSQTKETIKDDIKKFDGYDLETKDWKIIWDLLKDRVLSSFLKSHIGTEKTKVNRGKIIAPKYTEALLCRSPKECHKCGLLVVEGDSASSTAHSGLKTKVSPNFNSDYYGVFSIGGVPMNGLKDSVELSSNSSELRKTIKKSSKEKETKEKVSKKSINTEEFSVDLPERIFGDKNLQLDLDNIKVLESLTKRIPSKKIMDNERLSSLVKVLGLDYNKKYELNKTGDAEWNTLRYGFIVGLTDQDLDGFNIFGLVCTFIMTFWPALVKRNFIRKLDTPVIRATCKKNPSQKKTPKKSKISVASGESESLNESNGVTKQFYTEADFYKWVETVGESYVKKNYTIKYYKGLASHSNNEIKPMFINIDKKIKIYTIDENAFQSLDIYYGKSTDLRKKALSDAVMDNMTSGIKIPISQQFTINTKLYQRDNIIRKILMLPDGFIPSRRKVFYTMRKNNSNDEIKVQGVAGETVKVACYHHGEGSLEQTIIYMAQGFPTARNLPLLLPKGQFGTRRHGYNDAGSSRYTYVLLNTKLTDKLFRKEDDYILDYELIDGQRYEPKYYMPIVPYVLLESNHMPATGWSINIHARNLDEIFENTRKMIKGEIKECGNLSPWLKDYKGTLQRVNDKAYYVGAYKWNPNNRTIHIYELPPDIGSHKFITGFNVEPMKQVEKGTETGIQTYEYVEEVIDNSEYDIDIKVILKEGAYEKIMETYNTEFDPIISYFNMKSAVSHNINLIDENNRVVEYKKYSDVFNDWYKFRKSLYTVRIDREIIILEFELKMLENIQRFSANRESYKITPKTTDVEIIDILIKNNYEIFNHVIIKSPNYTKLEILRDLITKSEHGASYDYILNLSTREMIGSCCESREKKIAQIKQRLKDLKMDIQPIINPFKGAKIWLDELQELEDVINNNKATNWGIYEKFDVNNFEDIGC